MSDDSTAVNPTTEPTIEAAVLASSIPTKNEILQAAAEARLAEGFYIFPLSEDGKHPLSYVLNEQGYVRRFHNGIHSSYSASNGKPRTYTEPRSGKTKTTTFALQAWWDGLSVNFAIALFLSGLCVIDIDEGIADEQELVAFLAEYGIPITRCIRSGRTSSFGCHLYFKGVMESGNFAIPFHGKTVRGEVKSSAPRYVVGEGSFHKSGQQYTRLWDVAIEPTPTALFTSLLEKYPQTKTAAIPATDAQVFDGDAVTDEQFEAWAEANNESFAAPVFHKVKNAWMYIREAGCPWADKHTTTKPNEETDFAVFVPLNGKLQAKCVHESCQTAWTESSGWKSYRAWVEKKNGKKIPLQPSGTITFGGKTSGGSNLPNGSSVSAATMPDTQPTPTEPTEQEVKAIFHTEEEYDSVKPVTFAIAGFLQEDAVTFVGGLSGHAKTFILLSMCKALLGGTPLFGHSPFSVAAPAERVIYLIPESTLSPFKERMKKFGLEPFFRQGKFMFRTLSSNEDVELSDPRFLKAVKGSHIFLDTAVRFMDGEEVVDSKRFAETVFRILKAGAKSVTAAHHSAKAFETQGYMTLENVLRGSGDLGALCATCWGVKQTDEKLNQVVIKNVKPRDFKPCEPFVIQGRPFLDDTGDFKVVAADVVFDGKKHVYSTVKFSDEETTVLESYDNDKRLMMMKVLAETQKHTPKTTIAELIGKSDTTVAKYLDTFNSEVKELQKKKKGTS